MLRETHRVLPVRSFISASVPSMPQRYLIGTVSVIAVAVSACWAVENAVTRPAGQQVSTAPAPSLTGLVSDLRLAWPQNRIINIVCLGDSITAGYLQTPKVTRTGAYPGLLAAWLERKFPHSNVNVINAGIGG